MLDVRSPDGATSYPGFVEPWRESGDAEAIVQLLRQARRIFPCIRDEDSNRVATLHSGDYCIIQAEAAALMVSGGVLRGTGAPHWQGW